MMCIEYGLGYGVASCHTRLSSLDSIRFINAYSEFSDPERPKTEILALWSKSRPNQITEMLIGFLKEQNHTQAQ